MTNYDEMAALFVIENIEEHEQLFHIRQTRHRETIITIITDPFTLTDQLFIKNYN